MLVRTQTQLRTPEALNYRTAANDALLAAAQAQAAALCQAIALRSRPRAHTSQSCKISSREMRYAFTTTVKDGKMEEYLHYHDHIWPEVCRGLRAAGVTQLTIFRAPNTSTLFLYVTTAGATDLGEATGPRSRYREDPKCQEWEELMDADFHGGWTALDEVHASDREWVGALR